MKNSCVYILTFFFKATFSIVRGKLVTSRGPEPSSKSKCGEGWIQCIQYSNSAHESYSGVEWEHNQLRFVFNTSQPMMLLSKRPTIATLNGAKAG